MSVVVAFAKSSIILVHAFVYGVVRMFAVFAEVFAVQVNAFRTMDEGQRWLDERLPREAARRRP